MGSGTRARILVLCAALAAVSGATGASAQPAKWDQKRVTSIAQQLAVAVGQLYDNIVKLPSNANTPQRKVRFQALDDLRTLKQVSGSLARNLKDGKSREETYPTYQRIQTIRRDKRQGRAGEMGPEARDFHCRATGCGGQPAL